MNRKQLKIFPKNNYSIELKIDSTSATSKLKNWTLSKEEFIANWNNQKFIGEIKENEFEIKLSNKLFEEFCVVHGKLENKKGTLEIQIGKVLKIIFVLVILFISSGIITAVIQNKFEAIFSLIVGIIVLRFVFLELGFRYATKSILQKLTEIIEIKTLQKNNLF
jgi:K+-sensing histidine kinase KdpD